MTDSSDRPDPVPEVVVVGVASRDLSGDDPRGWRLGGGVTYAALALARLGVRTGAVMGVDSLAATAVELDLLRISGVDLRLVELEHGPVFENVETPDGRIQYARSVSDLVPAEALPATWRSASGWMIAPVAGEVDDAWADVIPDGSLVGLGWQGLLREVVTTGPVRRLPPRPSSLLARADVVGVSRDDLDPTMDLAALCRLLRPGADLIVTKGRRGGLAMLVGPEGPERLRRYGIVPSARLVDPTGAGDSFLAGVVAARLVPRLVGGRTSGGWDLRLGAVLASLVVEGPGLAGVPERPAVIARLRSSLTAATGADPRA
jgi:sugar/nucleoside kinase (ribokinase family)